MSLKNQLTKNEMGAKQRIEESWQIIENTKKASQDAKAAINAENMNLLVQISTLKSQATQYQLRISQLETALAAANNAQPIFDQSQII
jgi:hypothetical protein